MAGSIFDAIVIGLGAHGSAAAFALAGRGLSVLGLEAEVRGHELGSSGGRSRMIRRAYFEDPGYLPLLTAAWEGWDALGAAAGETFVEVTGGLYAGLADSDVFRGSEASARLQALPHEVLNGAEIRRRWPVFTVGDDVGGLYDPGAGMIRPERAIAAQLRLAETAGADLRFGERAVEWRPGPGGDLEVETDMGVHRARHLVIAAGAWTGSFVPDLALPLEVERVPVFWFEPTVPIAEIEVGRLPVWIIETTTDGAFYGFPHDPEAGLKVARHYSGDVIDPEVVDRAQRLADVDRVRTFCRQFFPAADGRLAGSQVCLYTNTPDRHFVLDVHPKVAGVAYASACSGHGFKFAPVIGAILADLALTGATRHPIDQFRANRFVTGPVAPGS
ncbi:MAG TPA: N-methyl-L-tryptophan oxidase [Candidatus Limnocylindrales bacterium]|nr:N-methyl-L-tryptophan oxidase [Candidatus Limnocylindrales bacterium]